ncbi:McrB family protein [Candidatus Poriferisodalis sp.]|uniref:McrB family protein n=1 Tax=Candidatus Poriferisodalis sp. TaxID=3101277 RepID=UPI003B515CB2
MIELLDKLELFDVDEASEAQAVVRLHEELGDCGAVIMRSNNMLLEVLRPYFSDDGSVDTFGMKQFLHWLAERYADDDTESDDDHDDDGDEPGSTGERLAIALGEAAEDLLCGVEFLNDIVELLEDKGQVILYGPPGTGKTYLAQRLAEALSPDTDARTLVQFHPAYSYEDFFEGYRPAVDDHGNMTYRLTAGPLMKIAELARANSGQRHVMVIDEINRANLPRVVGELLFLLEYRDRVIHTQYRPEEQFSLPENLWFIGTMNTADRSIALIDAAMRRRFHFVPFFPNRPPTQGLLGRWTQKHAPSQAPIADLLKEVNSELEQALGGDHLLIGPSHFMKRNLGTEALRRIWEYNIEPLIEDQLFGQQEVINKFRFGAVWARFGPDSGVQETHVDDVTECSEDEPGGNASE